MIDEGEVMRDAASRADGLGWKACGIKQVNAERIETWMGELIAELATSEALVDEAVAKANEARGADAEPLREPQATRRARIRDLDQRIDNLVDVLASNGAAALTSIEGKLREAESQQLGRISLCRHVPSRSAGEDLLERVGPALSLAP